MEDSWFPYASMSSDLNDRTRIQERGYTLENSLGRPLNKQTLTTANDWCIIYLKLGEFSKAVSIN